MSSTLKDVKSGLEWKEGDMITAKIKRDGKLQTVTGKYTISYVTSDGLITTDTSKENLKQAWLKG